MKCNYCGADNPADRVFCRICDKRLSTKSTISFAIKSVLIISVGIFIILVLFFNFPSGSLWTGNKDVTKDLGSMASVQCKNYVRDSLKSPASAKFSWTPNITKIDSNTFIIKTYVDAENSFGSTLRSDIYCKIHFTGGDDAVQQNWQIISLDLSQ